MLSRNAIECVQKMYFDSQHVELQIYIKTHFLFFFLFSHSSTQFCRSILFLSNQIGWSWKKNVTTNHWIHIQWLNVFDGKPAKRKKIIVVELGEILFNLCWHIYCWCRWKLIWITCVSCCVMWDGVRAQSLMPIEIYIYVVYIVYDIIPIWR